MRHVAVDDCGRILNPLLVAGQQHGGIAQGAAQALFEEVAYDDDGNPITSNLADYAIPSAAELPSFEVSNTQTDSPRNPLGAKGIGESGTIGSTPAIQNAVIDAVSHLGVKHIDMPCTAQRVWRAIQEAKASELTVRSEARHRADEGGADDAGLVLERGRDDLGADVDVRHPLVGLPAGAAADDDQRRARTASTTVSQVPLDPLGPVLPRQALAVAGRWPRPGVSASWPSISRWPSSVFGHQHAVDEQPRADAGAERQHEHDARHALAGAEAHLGEPGGVGVVDDVDVGAPAAFGEQRVGIGAEPRLVDVGRAVDRRRGARRRGTSRRRARPVEVLDELGDDVGHRLRRRRLRRQDLEPLGASARPWPGRPAPPSCRSRRCRCRRTLLAVTSRHRTRLGPNSSVSAASKISVWRSASAGTWLRREQRHVVERRQQHAAVQRVQVEERLQLGVAGGRRGGAVARRRAEPVLGPAAESLHVPRQLVRRRSPRRRRR